MNDVGTLPRWAQIVAGTLRVPWLLHWLGTLTRAERSCPLRHAERAYYIVRRSHPGWVFPADNGFQCFPLKPVLVRKTDVSFVRYGRLPGEVLPEGWIKIPHDLAVEVVSPNDEVEELEGKLDDYQQVGVALIWVIYPKSRSVMVHRNNRSVSRLLESDELSGEDVIPGFRCPVHELFPRREPVPEHVEPTATDSGQ